MRKKRKQRVRVIVLAFCVFLVCIITPATLSRAEFLSIKHIVVEGNKVVDLLLVEEVVRDTLIGNTFLFLKKGSAFTYSKKEIIDSVSSVDPRISDVAVSLEGLDTLRVSIRERIVFALWCDESDACFAMDSTGYIFGDVPEFSSGDMYPVYFGLFGEIPIGKQFLPVPQFQILEEYRKGLEKISLSPLSIRVFEDGTGEAVYANGSKIIFSVTENPDASLLNLVSAIEDPTTSLIENGMLTVYSIDLRFGNRIVVKKEPI